MAKTSAATALPADLKFEDAMQQLDVLVRQLESGQGSLDEAITNYEKGAALRAFCEQQLKDAELRISQIATTPDGMVTEEPFQDTKSQTSR